MKVLNSGELMFAAGRFPWDGVVLRTLVGWLTFRQPGWKSSSESMGMTSTQAVETDAFNGFSNYLFVNDFSVLLSSKPIGATYLDQSVFKSFLNSSISPLITYDLLFGSLSQGLVERTDISLILLSARQCPMRWVRWDDGRWGEMRSDEMGWGRVRGAKYGVRQGFINQSITARLYLIRVIR